MPPTGPRGSALLMWHSMHITSFHSYSNTYKVSYDAPFIDENTEAQKCLEITELDLNTSSSKVWAPPAARVMGGASSMKGRGHYL